MLFLGPIFQVEMTTSARRIRTYALRLVYGLILLYFIWTTSRSYAYSWSETGTAEFSIQQLAWIGQALFNTFFTVQSVTVLLLTPALVAGVVADEKQRKTLHYLLASSLSSFEIVIGKIASRLLQLLVFVAIGLPILSLVSLFGGVDPALVAVSFVTTLTTVFFLSTLSILISVHAKRPREAISLVYLLEVTWLIAPMMIRWILPSAGAFWLQVYEWIRPILEWTSPTSPLYTLETLARSGGASRAPALTEAVAWMCGLQLLYGTLFLTLAVWRLRPVYRSQGEGANRSFRQFLRKGRLLKRPDCGDDAMMWKERYVSRTSLLTKTVAAIVAVLSVSTMAYLTYINFAEPAFVELFQNGYGRGTTRARSEFNNFLRALCTAIYVLWMLALASSASSSLTSEREEDTWISLISTPLSGVEILRAKVFGAFWGLRWIAALMLALWLVGTAAGAIHPLGFFVVLAETLVFTSFVNVLATYLSLRCSTSSRSLLTSLIILIILNGGYLVCCIPLDNPSMVIAAGVTPMTEALSLVSVTEVQQFLSADYHPYRRGEAVLLCFVCVLVYAVGTVAIAVRAVDRFDEIIDRPRRPTWNPLLEARRQAVEFQSKQHSTNKKTIDEGLGN